MTELRLVPAALTVWAVVLATILSRGSALGIVVIGVAVLVCVLLRQWGQALFVAGVSCAGLVTCWLRIVRSRCLADLAGRVTLRVHGVRQTSSGGYLLDTGGLPVLVKEKVEAGSVITANIHTMPSDRPSVEGVLGIGRNIEVLRGGGWAQGMRADFAAAVARIAGSDTRGLIPGMVLGDTSLQTPDEQSVYISTGLSHLSAVSGSNIAIVTTVAVLTLGWAGPYIRTAGAAAVLLGYVFLVGPEPSVLRAAVTGVVGLTAVVASRRSEPVHALCLAVIGLVVWDSNLAVNYGFALSVAATAGIVVVSPLVAQALGFLPDLLARALAVAIAADVVTMPIIALMSGRVSLVSVVANLLAGIAVAPVTVLGLCGAVAMLLPGGGEGVFIRLAEPGAWWIHAVATWANNLPHATVGISAAWAVVVAGWIVYLILDGHPRLVATVVALVVIGGGHLPWRAGPPQATFNTVVGVNDYDGKDYIDAQVIVDSSPGRPHERATVTRWGQPVIYPERDGRVTIYADGTQHAESGAF
ncbi:ComEC/Rec2 family competence protein [Corynebacterium glucuronolyticum]|uniref:ComEC/Rec2 family competence protein n=1 Tax=Corynebacterium glucuronolyticum TaxID=39791 RepID=UPI00223B2EEB|nr:ComEC/Rec2 family competence protein [Corynebacterium glucuronolyticum]MCT1441593.1 ComEC/Rec2 family competence protein [Corynebacterium glucuronolyticum]